MSDINKNAIKSETLHRAKKLLSHTQLLLFALFFAAVGGILLYKSFALNPNLPGDVNNDNTVNVTDLSILLSNYNSNYPQADFNSDGTVSILDLSILLTNYSRTYTPPPPPPPPPSGGGGATNIWMSPSGNDSTCARGDSSKPCASLDRARDIAQCGDRVSIAGGTYNADQNVSSPTNACTTSPVVFTVVSGATANFNSIDLNSPGTTLVRINIPNTPGNTDLNALGYEINFDSNCDGCALLNSTIRTFGVWGADGVTIEGNTIDANGTDSSIEMQDGSAGDGGTNIVIRNNIITRFYTDFVAGSHSEGLNIGGYSNGVLVEGNTFTNNGTTSHVFLTYWGMGAYLGADPHTTIPRNVCIKSNSFGPTHGAYFDINFRTEIADVGPAQSGIKVDPAQNASTTNPEFNAAC